MILTPDKDFETYIPILHCWREKKPNFEYHCKLLIAVNQPIPWQITASFCLQRRISFNNSVGHFGLSFSTSNTKRDIQKMNIFSP
ncbi:hypothetical protein [Anaerolinea sp.]|uniref:hypothetical protein n=1 Tax=Anaerolinea sp. TaxID=1872519 RepID=UPI002ACD4BAC|nr:hypothetical protein [Anaerolinea sp.]